MALSPEDKDKLCGAFEKLGVVPKADTAEDLENWMFAYLKGKHKIPTSAGKSKVSPWSSEDESSEDKHPAPVVLNATPQVSIFSGDQKHHATFDAWRYEVEGLLNQKIYTHDVLAHAVRKSLRGEAGNIAMNLGHQASIAQLIEKLNGIYGTVDPKESLLTRFYTESQKPSESVASWGCRLEDILRKAQATGEVAAGVAHEMLRTKFWTGLNQKLKDASRHKYDSIKSFDKLLVEMRCIEQEHTPDVASGSKSVVKAMSVGKEDALQKSLDNLAKQLVSLQKEVADLKASKATPAPGCAQGLPRMEHSSDNNFPAQRGSLRCWKCSGLGHLKRDCPSTLNFQQPAAGGRR